MRVLAGALYCVTGLRAVNILTSTQQAARRQRGTNDGDSKETAEILISPRLFHCFLAPEQIVRKVSRTALEMGDNIGESGGYTGM